MKKSSLTTSVVAGLAGVAGLVNVSSALNVNPDGLGQVLIYPYYTVNGQNSTLVSIVNTTDDVKAVKVRFLEGRNSQEVLDFNLYLSPFDVWTGLVTDPQGDDTGRAILRSFDTSCIAPITVYNAIRTEAGQNFLDYQYAGTNKDGGPYHLERTREGHIEMIEMGRVVDDGDVSESDGTSVSAIDVLGGNPAPFAGSTLASFATHDDGVPVNCAAVARAWDAGGQWRSNANLDIDTPNGGLFGGGQIIDTSNGTNLSYNADAIEGFFVSESRANLHAFPGSVDPSLAFAQSSDGGEATAVIFDNGTLYQFTFTGADAGRNAVSAVFMHNEIYNEYVTNDGIGAQSEWVITFPTKRLHIEELLPSRLPFREIYRGDNVPPYANLAGACEPIDVEFFDREENTSGFIPDSVLPSPPPPNVEAPGLNLCFEAQVITFNQVTAGEVLTGNDPSGILGSFFPRNINLCQTYAPDDSCADDSVYTEGWLRMVLGDPALNFMFTDAVSADPAEPNILVGLPATGFWAANYVNSDAEPGLLANYSGIHKHRADRLTVAGSVDGDTLTYTVFGGSGE
ncbi:hypothetical protein [Chiayiivirga flava]|uniref:Uncharacterized protein n=1 Tax=Chiayiivirga flava TaxID=659595 RepID=A0A7W8FZQ2_9GAMM|nr:hypothetical protein [Chiayiivirga flava]MBB5208702.1 hypothetical protein [Chiayiivirga flava]